MTPVLEDSPEQWRRVASVLDAALEHEPAEWTRYLDEAGVEPALKAEVEALLVQPLTPSYLDSSALAFAAPLLRAGDSVPDGALRVPASVAALVRQLAEHAPDASLPSETLPNDPAAPYVFERKLARGGMASVYLARDVKHDRRVAIKVLDAALTTRVGAERFVQEIRLTARLQHPHVLGLLDSGVFGTETGSFAGRPYYVMPYIEGESLRARLTRAPLTPSEAVRILREVADALSYAHEQGVIHRDIKPENILLSREHAVVADFGIAKALSASQHGEPNDADRMSPAGFALAQLSALVGTPAYMAPEQATRGTPVDHRADLYAWGVVAYELFAGRHPFERSTTAHDFIAAHASDVPFPLHRATPELPRRAAALVMQCLAKRPSDRPVSAAVILTALDKSSTGGTPGIFASSRRRLSLALALTILLVAAILSGESYRRRQPILIAATGDAARDLRAFQAAMDRGGDVMVQGHFSFALPPTKPIPALLASGYYPRAAEILISKAVNLSGVRDAHGEMATIDGGTIPLYVDAPSAHVRIRGVRFVRPTSAAILVRGVRGLEISESKIERVIPFSVIGQGIAIDTRGSMPLPNSVGNPEDISGQILISNNTIDGTGGTADAVTNGITVFSAGQAPEREANVDLISNQITNVSTTAIMIRRVDGNVRIVGNTVRTSTETRGDVDAVRLIRAKSFLVVNNTVECKWPNAAAIQIFSPFSEWHTEHAVVSDNDVIMSPPPGATLGDFSAGISIRGFAGGDTVRRNRITGRARAALSTYVFRGGVPADNAFLDNRLEQFESTMADIFVGDGVERTRVTGPGSLVDRGVGTIRQR